jgi:predicted nucleic acid-binding Zn ribbon protein
MRGLEPIGTGLEQELGRLGPPGAISAVVAAWPDAVGPAIAANAWPARIARDGTLHVSTSSSAWAFELTQLEETVRARLRERLGDACPERLRFTTGRLPEPGRDPVETSKQALPRPSAAMLAAAEAIAAPIADRGLRAAVARAAAASLAGAERRPDDRSF